MVQNNGESGSSEVPVKPVIKKKRLIWDIQIDPDDADMAGASEEAIKMMTQSRRVSCLLTHPLTINGDNDTVAQMACTFASLMQ